MAAKQNGRQNNGKSQKKFQKIDKNKDMPQNLHFNALVYAKLFKFYFGYFLAII